MPMPSAVFFRDMAPMARRYVADAASFLHARAMTRGVKRLLCVICYTSLLFHFDKSFTPRTACVDVMMPPPLAEALDIARYAPMIRRLPEPPVRELARRHCCRRYAPDALERGAVRDAVAMRAARCRLNTIIRTLCSQYICHQRCRAFVDVYQRDEFMRRCIRAIYIFFPPAAYVTSYVAMPPPCRSEYAARSRCRYVAGKSPRRYAMRVTQDILFDAPLCAMQRAAL